MSNIVTLAEADAAANYFPESKDWYTVLATGRNQDSIYPLHSHHYEQTSVIIQGRMRLTVGDEVREVGPGDMWFVSSDVPHGGEILGDESVIFIDVYSPSSGGSDEAVTYY